MRYLVIVIFLLLVSVENYAQQTVGKILPGENFTNHTEELIFYMPRSKAVTLMNYQTKVEFDSIRLEKYKQLTSTMEMRIAKADSAITLRALEAEYWKMQLEKNDRELEQIRIKKEMLVDENQRIRKSRIYYTLAGMIAASIVIIPVTCSN